MVEVIKENEVLLYGSRFPIYGTVRRTAVTPFAPKITIGNYTRDDHITKSSWVLDDFSGGSGILYATLPRDADRYWYSTLETKYRYLSLLPQIEGGQFFKDSSGNALKIKADFFEEFGGKMYATAGSTVQRWSEVTQSWTHIKTLDAPATGIEVFAPPSVGTTYLYILTATSLHRFDGVNTWVDYPAFGGYSMVEWDGKLFALDLNNQLWWSINPTDAITDVSQTDSIPPTWTDWTTAGYLHVNPSDCRQLIVYFDLSGEAAIHAITRIGVFGYDFASKRFHKTPLIFPYTEAAGSGADIFRGELHVPAGTMVYKYNGSTIQVVSPTRDDGLPAHLRGNVTSIVPGHAFLYAVISTDTGETTGSLIYPTDDDENVTQPERRERMFVTGDMLEHPTLPVATTAGAVLVSPGMAWHSMFDEVAGYQIGAARIASIEGTFRLWVSTTNGVYYIDVPPGMHNPLQNPTTRYRESGYLETGWTDLGWVEMSKLALTLDVHATNCTDTERIRVYAAWDNVDEWKLLGEVTESGRSRYEVAGEQGRVFKSVRIRIEMDRGTNPIKTPVLHAALFTFVRRPEMLWGWTIGIDLTKERHGGRSTEEILERLIELTEDTKIAGRFSYRNKRDKELRSHRVIISNIEGAERSGRKIDGRFTVSLIQLDDVREQELFDG